MIDEETFFPLVLDAVNKAVQQQITKHAKTRADRMLLSTWAGNAALCCAVSFIDVPRCHMRGEETDSEVAIYVANMILKEYDSLRAEAAARHGR